MNVMSICVQHGCIVHLVLKILLQGRNSTEVVKMIATIRAYNSQAQQGGRPEITISVELEKTRPELTAFYCLPDVLFVSKEYSIHLGCHTAEEAVVRMKEMAKEG